MYIDHPMEARMKRKKDGIQHLKKKLISIWMSEIEFCLILFESFIETIFFSNILFRLLFFTDVLYISKPCRYSFDTFFIVSDVSFHFET